jgi:hypothetical protein
MTLYQTMKVVAATTQESGDGVMSDLTADRKTHNGKSRMLRGMCVKECDMISSLGSSPLTLGIPQFRRRSTDVRGSSRRSMELSLLPCVKRTNTNDRQRRRTLERTSVKRKRAKKEGKGRNATADTDQTAGLQVLM